MLGLRHSAADDEGYPLARASVMNLIAYAAQGGHQEHARRSVDELAIRHPSRAIVVALEPGKSFSLDAEVFLYRHPLASHGLVYERALLHARGADPESLDTLVIPLLIPHLQSFLWWLDDPRVDDPGLRSLAAICDRLVIDSALGPASRLRELSQLIGSGAPTLNQQTPAFARLVLGDVAWARLDGFRRTLVQVFDEGDRAEFLEGVTALEILGVRGSKGAVTSAEVLFGGWLAARLGWTMPAWAPGGVTMREGTRRVTMTFAGTRGLRAAADAPPLHGVRLEAELGKRRLSVDLTTSRSEAHLVVSETGTGTARRTIPIPHISETESLSRELARIGRDRVYEDSMIASSRILAALES
jgi:glucose-6-phosphate dehydrogenase assembly protein OpcA